MYTQVDTFEYKSITIVQFFEAMPCRVFLVFLNSFLKHFSTLENFLETVFDVQLSAKIFEFIRAKATMKPSNVLIVFPGISLERSALVKK